MLVSDSTTIDDDYESAISAAILHDVLEDTDTKIPEHFPGLVHLLVDQLTKKHNVSKIDTMRELVNTGHDLAILIKMADMVDNLKDGLESFDNGLQWAKRHAMRGDVLLNGAIARDRENGAWWWSLQNTTIFKELKLLIETISK